MDLLVERRSSSQDAAEREREEMYAQSVRRDRQRRRQENQAAWYGFHFHMQELHTQLAQEHAAKAEALLEEPGGGDA